MGKYDIKDEGGEDNMFQKEQAFIKEENWPEDELSETPDFPVESIEMLREQEDDIDESYD